MLSDLNLQKKNQAIKTFWGIFFFLAIVTKDIFRISLSINLALSTYLTFSQLSHPGIPV